jgi:hypothetical protein
MRRTLMFAEGFGAGAGFLLTLAAVLLMSRSRAVSSTMRKMSEGLRSGRSPWTGEPPDNYLELCRAAGL